jgi:hypothetical protein
LKIVTPSDSRRWLNHVQWKPSGRQQSNKLNEWAVRPAMPEFGCSGTYPAACRVTPRRVGLLILAILINTFAEHFACCKHFLQIVLHALGELLS